jgi:hypothetical protein
VSPTAVVVVTVVGLELAGLVVAVALGKAAAAVPPAPPARPSLRLVPKEVPETMPTTTPTAPTSPASNRLDELEADIARRRLTKRELRRKLARAEWLLEVRSAGMLRLHTHNGNLEERLRAVGYADLATLEVDDIDTKLLDELRRLGDSYGPRGVILAALTVLGGRR